VSSILETLGPLNGASPLSRELTETGTVELQAAFAIFDGSAAAGAYRPALTIRAQNGTLLARVFPADELAAGDSAGVTFAPFLRSAAATPPPSGATVHVGRFQSPASHVDNFAPDGINVYYWDWTKVSGSSVFETQAGTFYDTFGATHSGTGWACTETGVLSLWFGLVFSDVTVVAGPTEILPQQHAGGSLNVAGQVQGERLSSFGGDPGYVVKAQSSVMVRHISLADNPYDAFLTHDGPLSAYGYDTLTLDIYHLGAIG